MIPRHEEQPDPFWHRRDFPLNVQIPNDPPSPTPIPYIRDESGPRRAGVNPRRLAPSPALEYETAPQMSPTGRMGGPSVNQVWASAMAHYVPRPPTQAAGSAGFYHRAVHQPPGFQIAPSMAQAGANVLAEATRRNVQRRKNKQELCKSVDELSGLLGYCDKVPYFGERQLRVKDRLEMFLNITKNIRDVMIDVCTPRCDDTVHKDLSLVEFPFRQFREDWTTYSLVDFQQTMKNISLALFRFILHILEHHRAELEKERQSFKDVVATYKLLYTFACQFELMHASDTPWLQHWFQTLSDM